MYPPGQQTSSIGGQPQSICPFSMRRKNQRASMAILTAAKDKLVFEDGTPVRFWGTNLTAYALFGTTRENVRLQAHRLSELGFNLVRIHPSRFVLGQFRTFSATGRRWIRRT